MSKSCKRVWRSLVGLGFATCGITKILGISIQEKRFADLKWSQCDMKKLGSAQVVGALLLTCKKTSKLGAFLLAATALCLFVTGLKHNRKEELALDGLGIFAALTILFSKKK